MIAGLEIIQEEPDWDNFVCGMIFVKAIRFLLNYSSCCFSSIGTHEIRIFIVLLIQVKKNKLRENEDDNF